MILRFPIIDATLCKMSPDSLARSAGHGGRYDRMRVNGFQLTTGNIIVGRKGWVFKITPHSESRVVRIRFKRSAKGGFLLVKRGALLGTRGFWNWKAFGTVSQLNITGP